MKKLSYTIEIKAPAQKVYDEMIDSENYTKWTAVFNPTSRFEGSWEKGEKIRFIGVNEETGEKGGMLAEIAENIPGEFISIRHYGMLMGDTEITSGPEVEKWAPAFENYTFEEKDGNTRLQVEVDTDEEYIDFFDETWPKALEKIKELSEN